MPPSFLSRVVMWAIGMPIVLVFTWASALCLQAPCPAPGTTSTTGPWFVTVALSVAVTVLLYLAGAQMAHQRPLAFAAGVAVALWPIALSILVALAGLFG